MAALFARRDGLAHLSLLCRQEMVEVEVEAQRRAQSEQHDKLRYAQAVYADSPAGQMRVLLANVQRYWENMRVLYPGRHEQREAWEGVERALIAAYERLVELNPDNELYAEMLQELKSKNYYRRVLTG